MGRVWKHYESAFEQYLRSRRVPYVSVDEARRTLLPEGADFSVRAEHPGDPGRPELLKSFDYVIYGDTGREGGPSNLLVEVKGRKIGRPSRGVAALDRPIAQDRPRRAGRAQAPPRLECWVTLDDVTSMQRWRRLFGGQFAAAFVFIYWCDQVPPDGLFHEVFEHAGRWYTVRGVDVERYAERMRLRSPRWRTVDLPPAVFEELAAPVCG
ncbi:MAG: hypothetical protein FJ255_05155 [Phycisphaerae bacterium]|nr:hypothetical protein [Phycisphaerae bacterium]